MRINKKILILRMKNSQNEKKQEKLIGTKKIHEKEGMKIPYF